VNDHLIAAADRLDAARATGVPCAPVRDLIGDVDLGAAYAVQRLQTERRVAEGRRIVGRKIGLTSRVVQDQFGVATPDFGAIFDDLVHSDGAEMPVGAFVSPRVEGEIAFVLNADLDSPTTNVVDVLRATEFVLPAIEIVDSRIAGWDIRITDTIADNASSGGVVLGTTPFPITGTDLTEVGMVLEHRAQPVSTGAGSACLGSPVNAVAWLARAVAAQGDRLRAGDVVLSGALGPMVAVGGPGRYRLDLSGLGHVEFTFTDEEAAS
jgi:2-keto-4-pentenoate hydratase